MKLQGYNFQVVYYAPLKGYLKSTSRRGVISGKVNIYVYIFDGETFQSTRPIVRQLENGLESQEDFVKGKTSGMES